MEDEVVDSIRSKLELAVDIVSDVEEPLRAEAFKVVLSYLMGQNNSYYVSKKVDKGEGLAQMSDNSTIYDALAKSAESTPETMSLLFNYDESDKKISFNITFDPSKIAPSQQDLVLLYLTVKHFGFNVNEEKDSEIRSLLERHKVPVKNLPRNLGNSDRIVVQGTKKKERIYAITPKGWKKGIEILKAKAQEYS